MILTRNFLCVFKLNEELFQLATLAALGLFETLPDAFANIGLGGEIE